LIQFRFCSHSSIEVEAKNASEGKQQALEQMKKMSFEASSAEIEDAVKEVS